MVVDVWVEDIFKTEIIAFIVRIGYSIAAANMSEGLQGYIGYKDK